MASKLCPFCMRMTDSEICPHCGKNINYTGKPMHLPAGYVVHGKHPYVIGAGLGQGGFGITYIALDMVTSERVAIKEFFPTFCCGRTGKNSVIPYESQEETFQKGKDRFLDEARVLKSLSDLKSIVNVLDFFEFNNSAYLVMEYLDGSSLKDHAAKNGKFPAQTFLTQIQPLMEDIERMHQRGVVHRDIAPDNIILLPDGQMKLIDFGAARSFVGDKSMTVVVKKGFAPVEQYMTKGATAATDVYALAATMYYCITGVVPLDSAERQYEGTPLQSPSSLGVDITPEQEKAMDHALAIMPKDRPQSVETFLKLLNEKPAPTKTNTTKSQPEKKKKKKKLLPILGAAAAVLALAVGGFIIAQSGPKAPSTPETLPPQVFNETEPHTETSPQETDTVPTTPAIVPASEITLWTYPIGGWGNQETVTALMAEFEAATGIKVTVEYLDYTNGDDKVNTAIEFGDAPDLIMEGPERLVAQWGKNGRMVDLSDMLDSTDLSELNPAALAACTAANGELYEYPLVMTTHCMAINKTVFETAGAMKYLNEKTHTWNSVEDFWAAMDAVYSYTGKTVGAVFCGGQGGDQGTRALVTNLYGGTFTNPEHTAYTWDSAENVAALEALKACEGIEFNEGIVGGDEIALFYQGNLNMAFCWNIAQQRNPNTANTDAGKTANGDDILFMAFPSDTTPQLCGGVWGFGIFNNGDDAKIAAAKQFIKYFCDSEATASAVKAANYFAVRNTAEGADLSGIWADNAIMAEYNKLMPMLGDYYQVTPSWRDARTAWWNMLQQVGNSNGSREIIRTIVKNAVTQIP